MHALVGVWARKKRKKKKKKKLKKKKKKKKDCTNAENQGGKRASETLDGEELEVKEKRVGKPLDVEGGKPCREIRTVKADKIQGGKKKRKISGGRSRFTEGKKGKLGRKDSRERSRTSGPRVKKKKQEQRTICCTGGEGR